MSTQNFTLRNGKYKANVTLVRGSYLVTLSIGKNDVAVRSCGMAVQAANIYAHRFVDHKIVADNFTLCFGTIGIFEVAHIDLSNISK